MGKSGVGKRIIHQVLATLGIFIYFLGRLGSHNLDFIAKFADGNNSEINMCTQIIPLYLDDDY